MGSGRASQLSSRRSSSSKKLLKDESKKFDNGVVNEKTWMSSKTYGSLIVPDPSNKDSEGYKFIKGNVVAILPEDKSPTDPLEPIDYWIGEIKEIRAQQHDADSNSVFVKVGWFYTATDTGRVIQQSFNQSVVGSYERINSDDWDFVAPDSFNETIIMHKFDERDPEQAYIPRSEFYYRYSLETKTRHLTPKQTSFGCTCMQPYDPNDLGPSNIMHFCPRPGCRRAYHQTCLLRSGSIEKDEGTSVKRKKITSPTKSTNSHSLRLLACSPDTDSKIDLQSLMSDSVRRPSIFEENDSVSDTDGQQPPKKKRRTRSSFATADSSALHCPHCGPTSAPKIKIRVQDPYTPPEGQGLDTEGQQSPKKKKRQTRSSITSSEPRCPHCAPTSTLSAPLLKNAKQRDSPNAPSLFAVLQKKIPADLLQIAQQPLVRGAAFAAGGVSGNIGFVTRARRLVYQILQGNVTLSTEDKWQDRVFGADSQYGLKNAIVKVRGFKQALPSVLCPHCMSAI